MPPAAATDSVGEVIEASTTSFTAESRRLDSPPPFGSFVRILPSLNSGSEVRDPFEETAAPTGTVYGVVMEARTASRDPNRRAASFGLSEDDLRREQPQIWELLATDFVCLTIAHASEGEIRPYLPPRPPRLHAPVQPCSESEVCRIVEGLAFLRAISTADCACCDELMAAALREGYRCSGKDDEFLVRAGKQLAALLTNDYERLAAILRKLR